MKRCVRCFVIISAWLSSRSMSWELKLTSRHRIKTPSVSNFDKFKDSIHHPVHYFRFPHFSHHQEVSQWPKLAISFPLVRPVLRPGVTSILFAPTLRFSTKAIRLPLARTRRVRARELNGCCKKSSPKSVLDVTMFFQIAGDLTIRITK